MKRSLLVLSLVLLVAAPSFGQALAAEAVRLPGFGWGVCINGAGPFVWLGIAGDDFVGSVAWQRANIIAGRIDGSVLAPGSQVYLAKVCGSADYKIVWERCDADGVLRRVDLVTIDARTSKPYGATNHQLGSFWLKRLMGAQMRATAALDGSPTAAMMALSMAMPKDVATAFGANWRNWKSAGTLMVPCHWCQ